MSNETPEQIARKILFKVVNAIPELTSHSNFDTLQDAEDAIADAIRKERVVTVPCKKRTDESSWPDTDYADGFNNSIDEIKILNKDKTFVEGK